MSEDDQFTVISEVYRSERRSKVLTRLPTNFYKISESYLASQKDEYNKAFIARSNAKAMMLGDQIKKLEKRLKSVYEIRERKITLAALDNMGGSKAPDNLTRKDRELYELLTATLRSFRDGIDPPSVPEGPKPAPVVEAVKEPEVIEPLQTMDPIPTDPKPEKKDSSIIVHVLEDIPNFVGMDNTYDLKKDDMVTLPSQFAALLSSRGKVKIVEA